MNPRAWGWLSDFLSPDVVAAVHRNIEATRNMTRSADVFDQTMEGVVDEVKRGLREREDGAERDD